MIKKNVLFICIHNSGRSQMGEAFLRHFAGDRFAVFSAGIESGVLNPLVVTAMNEVGISMEGHYAKKVSEYIESQSIQGAQKSILFDYVITVCDETNAERCPLLPGNAVRLHWGFSDPSALTGTDEEKLAGIRVIRDEIKAKIQEWISETFIQSSQK